MGNSILVPLNDSISSKGVIDFLLKTPLCPNTKIAFIHIFRKPTSGEALMGKKFMDELPSRFENMLQSIKNRMITEQNFKPEDIRIELINMTHATVTEEIIDYFNSGKFDMVVIGRKEMSKSEEFILGDVSIKLIRALPRTAILVVKSG